MTENEGNEIKSKMYGCKSWPISKSWVSFEFRPKCFSLNGQRKLSTKQRSEHSGQKTMRFIETHTVGSNANEDIKIIWMGAEGINLVNQVIKCVDVRIS